MKLINFIIKSMCGFPILISFASCDDFLDRDPSDRITEEEVFQKIQTAEEYLNNAYTFLPDFQTCTEDLGGRYKLGGGTDEIGYQQTAGVTQTPYDFNNGNWNAAQFPMQRSWTDFYACIRRANVFMSNYDLIPDEVSTGGTSNRKQRLLGEAYGLRAFYYFQLFTMWGGVPIVDKPIDLGETTGTTLTRASASEIVDFILQDLETAASMLPANHDESQLGRFTQTIAKALASRLTLYYASQYWNPENDITKWQTAASTAKAAIDYAEQNGYRLADNYADIFSATVNPEVIWCKNSGGSECVWWNWYGFPLGYGGWYVDGPLQEMVDSYEMAATGEIPVLGYDENDNQIINLKSGYDPVHPFEGRDSRFYVSILYHGAQWQGRAVDVSPTGLDNINIGGVPRVNYFTRKYLWEQHNLTTGSGNSYRRFAIIRLAELYLNYAEALNEAEGPTAEVYNAVNKIRRRAQLLDLPANLTKDEMRNKIRQERRVELAFENHRFWDVRRWKIAEIVDNKKVHKITVNADGTYSYPVFQNRVFDKAKHYLFPIPQSEIDKNRNLVQNPGWN